MKKILPVLFLLLSIFHAHARIGETLDQCQLRYGVMVRCESKYRPDYPQYVFQKDGVEIRVRLYNGLSAQEIFSNVDESKLSSEQERIIREANNAGSENIRAQIDYRIGVLVLTTVEFEKVFHNERSGF